MGLQNSRELSFDEVLHLWLTAAGKDTGGIAMAFAPPPPNVERWIEEHLPASEIDDFRFIGDARGGGFDQITGGTHRVGDLQPETAPSDFEWKPEWAIVAVRDPENDARVILDGNVRARLLHAAVAAGAIPGNQPIRVVTGDLHLGLVFVAKAVSTLWR